MINTAIDLYRDDTPVKAGNPHMKGMKRKVPNVVQPSRKITVKEDISSGSTNPQDRLFIDQERPVEIDYVGQKLEGTTFDMSRLKFFIVRFLGKDVKPENREKAVYMEGSTAFWLTKFNRKTLDFSILPEDDLPPKGKLKMSKAIFDALDKQRVPEWLLPKLEKAETDDLAASEKPVREIVPTIAVREADDEEGPITGWVYTVHYIKGGARELYIPMDNRGQKHFYRATFLRHGRKGHTKKEISALMLDKPSKAVPHFIINKMEVEASARHEAIAPRNG